MQACCPACHLVRGAGWLLAGPHTLVPRYKYNETRDWGLTFNTLWDRLGKRIDYALLRLSDPALHLCDIEP